MAARRFCSTLSACWHAQPSRDAGIEAYIMCFLYICTYTDNNVQKTTAAFKGICAQLATTAYVQSRVGLTPTPTKREASYLGQFPCTCDRLGSEASHVSAYCHALTERTVGMSGFLPLLAHALYVSVSMQIVWDTTLVTTKNKIIKACKPVTGLRYKQLQ